ncbi:Hypp334 [Branchiostoma lanceolatum]|uniref:Hypp334 protein n=1 Tax=Branchiostoma lanceolatum TaxID=7740 RepID=A0A8J9YPA4_BRALA|nr:Hypp334 [Branchiostoma lanceolatum]
MAAPSVSGAVIKEVKHWSRNLRPVPPISHAFIKKWARAEQKLPQKTLKKGYSFFAGAYIHDVEVREGCQGVTVRGKCFPSMRKHDDPKQLKMSISSDKKVECTCSCTAGKGTCNHSVALLYQLSHYQNLGLHNVPPIASKTSVPQQWHKPRTHGVKPDAISKMTIKKTDVPKMCPQPKKKGISTTQYNPVRGSLVEASQNFASSLAQMLSPQDDQPQLLQLLPQNWPGSVTSKVGDVPAGSTLAHQQAISQPSDTVLTIADAPDRPQCPRPVLSADTPPGVLSR